MRRIVAGLILMAFASAPESTGAQDRDCPDFNNQQDAQAYFESRGGSSTRNVDRLDSDGDGLACELLPSRPSSGAGNRQTSTADASSGWRPTEIAEARSSLRSSADDDNGIDFVWYDLSEPAVALGWVLILTVAFFVVTIPYILIARVIRAVRDRKMIASPRTNAPVARGTNIPQTSASFDRPLPAQGYDTRTMPYADYLRTSEWSAIRQGALRRAGYRCQLCNRSGRLEDHHRTYERRGREEPGDVIALCEACHEKFHSKSGLQR